MNLLAPTKATEWACDDSGLAVFFKNRRDYRNAQQGKGNETIRRVHFQFERLLESGDANVEESSNGIYLPTPDAVRLDPESRELFQLPPTWPGNFKLEVHSVPNLSDFSAALRVIDIDGHALSNWKLRGPILEAGSEFYLPDVAQYACLEAFNTWQSLKIKTEADHLRFIFALTDAASHGCRIDLTQAGDFHTSKAQDFQIDAREQLDGSVLLTPVPLIAELGRLLGKQTGAEADPDGVYDYDSYRADIEQRLGQLQGPGNEAVLRIRSHVILLDEAQTIQARAIARSPRVPPQQKAEFQAAPEKWLAEHIFVHGEVEFLPRVIGIGEWTGGYLGTAGELGEKIDWFDRMPEPESKASIASEDGMIAEEDCADFEDPTAENQKSLVAIIEKNEEDIAWGLRSDHADHPDTICVQPEFDRYPRRPFPHQEEAIHWLANHAKRCGKPGKWEDGQKYWGAGALLADDMGLGKTFSTLLFLSEWHRAWRHKTGEVPPACLVVCPLSLVENWQQEISLSFPGSCNPFSRVIRAIPDGDLPHFFSTPKGKDIVENDAPESGITIKEYGLKFGDGSDKSLDQPGTIVLTTYNTLRDYRFSFAGCEWSAVIFDEAQNIKNPNAMQTIAAKTLKGFFRIALSGTPVENHLFDLWSIMDAVEPGALGSFNDFKAEWIRPLKKNPDGLQALGEKLRDRLGPLLLRRTKEDSLSGLPSKKILPVKINMTPEQTALYDEILQCANAPVDAESLQKRNNRWLASLWELRRISLHPALLGDAQIEIATNAKLSRKYLRRSAKLAWLLDKLDEIRLQGEKILIFSVQKKLQELLKSHLSMIYNVKIPVINGDTKAVATRKSNETRLNMIAEFSASPGFGICVLSPIAAGAGLNITAANHVIHLERHWNPAKEDQATDRAYRIGQKKDVQVYLPLLDHPTREITTFDTGLDRLINQKKRLAGSLGLIPMQSVSTEDLYDAILKDSAVKPALHSQEYLTPKKAAELSWEYFEALIAEIYERESDRVILTSRGSDHGTDVVVIGSGERENLLIQVKTTKLPKLDSEHAIREVEGSVKHFESILKLKFQRKLIHTNASKFSRRTAKSAHIYSVQLLGLAWLSKALNKHSISISDVIARSANREKI